MAGQREDVFVIPTGRHGLPANVVAEHQRERLLAATIAVVAKRGYRGTSVDHIVKAAKVGYVAFYNLFDGKESCFLAAFERIVAETRAQLAAAISPEQDWPEQICSGLASLIESIAADPARARVGLVEVQAAGRAAFARYQEAIDLAIPKLREGRALRTEGVALSDTLEEAIIGAIAWIFQRRLVSGERGRIDELLEETIQTVLSPYMGETEAHMMASEFAARRA